MDVLGVLATAHQVPAQHKIAMSKDAIESAPFQEPGSQSLIQSNRHWKLATILVVSRSALGQSPVEALHLDTNLLIKGWIDTNTIVQTEEMIEHGPSVAVGGGRQFPLGLGIENGVDPGDEQLCCDGFQIDQRVGKAVSLLEGVLDNLRESLLVLLVCLIGVLDGGLEEGATMISQIGPITVVHVDPFEEMEGITIV